jgi:hypothetical protein
MEPKLGRTMKPKKGSRQQLPQKLIYNFLNTSKLQNHLFSSLLFRLRSSRKMALRSISNALVQL